MLLSLLFSGDNQNDSFGAAPKYVKHISRSASELSNHEGAKANSSPPERPFDTPHRSRGVINPAVTGVLQRTHGFFSTLKVSDMICTLYCVCASFIPILSYSIDGREVEAKNAYDNRQYVTQVAMNWKVTPPTMRQTIVLIQPHNRQDIDRQLVDHRWHDSTTKCEPKVIQ